MNSMISQNQATNKSELIQTSLIEKPAKEIWNVDYKGEVCSIVRDGIRGYLSSCGCLWVVHKSTTALGNWQWSTYDINKNIVVNATQYQSVDAIFCKKINFLKPEPQVLTPEELEPYLKKLIIHPQN